MYIIHFGINVYVTSILNTLVMHYVFSDSVEIDFSISLLLYLFLAVIKPVHVLAFK